jgi:hypothetical protein
LMENEDAPNPNPMDITMKQLVDKNI